MLQNLTNFFNLIRTRKIKTQLADNDLIAVGTRDNTWGGNYQPTAITYANLLSEIETQVLTIAAIKFTYEIGQYVPAEGGVVFHRWLSTTPFGTPTSGTVENYLIIDTTDLSASAQWATANFDIPNTESTWNGFGNTASCIAVAGPTSGITGGVAAELCFSNANSGKNDWYLPAIYELSKLNENLRDVNQGLAVSGGIEIPFGTYWSSTENTNTRAAVFSFGGNTIAFLFKVTSGYVRAVRRFSI